MFLGDREIKKVSKQGDYVLVSFQPVKDKDGNKVKIPSVLTSQRYVDELQTEEPTDSGDFAHREKLLVAEDIYNVFLGHNIEIESAEKILEHVVYSANNNYKQKFGQFIGKDYWKRTFLDIKL